MDNLSSKDSKLPTSIVWFIQNENSSSYKEKNLAKHNVCLEKGSARSADTINYFYPSVHKQLFQSFRTLFWGTHCSSHILFLRFFGFGIKIRIATDPILSIPDFRACFIDKGEKLFSCNNFPIMSAKTFRMGRGKSCSVYYSYGKIKQSYKSIFHEAATKNIIFKCFFLWAPAIKKNKD